MYVLLKYRTGGGNIVVIEEGEEQMARDTVVVKGAVKLGKKPVKGLE
jgi:hypothetical protein